MVEEALVKKQDTSSHWFITVPIILVIIITYCLWYLKKMWGVG